MPGPAIGIFLQHPVTTRWNFAIEERFAGSVELCAREGHEREAGGRISAWESGLQLMEIRFQPPIRNSHTQPRQRRGSVPRSVQNSARPSAGLSLRGPSLYRTLFATMAVGKVCTLDAKIPGLA